MPAPLPPYPTSNLYNWAVQIVSYLKDRDNNTPEEVVRVVKLQHMTGDEKAIEDGVVMYDPVNTLPVFSKSGAWYYFDGTAV